MVWQVRQYACFLVRAAAIRKCGCEIQWHWIGLHFHLVHLPLRALTVHSVYNIIVPELFQFFITLGNILASYCLSQYTGTCLWFAWLSPFQRATQQFFVALSSKSPVHWSHDACSVLLENKQTKKQQNVYKSRSTKVKTDIYNLPLNITSQGIRMCRPLFH